LDAFVAKSSLKLLTFFVANGLVKLKKRMVWLKKGSSVPVQLFTWLEVVVKHQLARNFGDIIQTNHY